MPKECILKSFAWASGLGYGDSFSSASGLGYGDISTSPFSFILKLYSKGCSIG
jgi:hypothetical protein